MKISALFYVLFFVLSTICAQPRRAETESTAPSQSVEPPRSADTHSDSDDSDPDAIANPSASTVRPVEVPIAAGSKSSGSTTNHDSSPHKPTGIHKLPPSGLPGKSGSFDGATPTPHHHPPPDLPISHPGAASGQKPVLIVLEVLGGILALFMLFALTRCLISYRRTPHRDRVAAFIHRHQLQREMEELEEQQNAAFFRRTSLREPPPPPYLRPPEYGQEPSIEAPLFPISFTSLPISPEPPPHQAESRPDTPVQTHTR